MHLHHTNMPNSTTFFLFSFPFFLLAVAGADIPAIIVFGDSSVDAGNNNQINTILKSNFQPYGRDFSGGKPTGRFSNGRIPTDFLSEAFGLKPTVPAYLDPMYNITDFATGVCFASAGTGFDNKTSDVLSVIPLWKEVEYFKEYKNKLKTYAGDEKSEYIIKEALYIVSLGTNDFLENYYTMNDRKSQYNIEQYQVFLGGIAEKFVAEIYNLGARKIVVTGLPPMGCLPLERTTNFLGGNGNGCVDLYNNVSLEFNDKVSKMVKKMNTEFKGIKLVFSNPYYIFMNIVNRPSHFGFESTSVACCGTGMLEMGYTCDKYNPFTCSDANKYVFWDAFHPTEKTSKIISDYVFKHFLYVFL